MTNLTRSISSKMPKGPRQEIPTGNKPKSGRSRTKQAAWKREQETQEEKRPYTREDYDAAPEDGLRNDK